MAGGNKKKKKPAANPARGFATTSVVSKGKLEALQQDTISTEASDIDSPASVSTAPTSEDVKPTETVAPEKERELHELSPEELEAQLETSELQQLVEQHAAKARKEASRQVSRLQTDRRVLRGQAEHLIIKDWLPDELMQQLLELTLQDEKAQLNDPSSNERPNVRKTFTEDILLTKVWQLRLCLLELYISAQRVEEVLRHLIHHPPSEESATQLWGLPEALEWLALHCREDELLGYDTEPPKHAPPFVSDVQPGK